VIRALSLSDLRSFAQGERTRFETLLKELVEIPTVSADPSRKKDIARAAEFVADTIRSFSGAVHVYRPRGGNPILHGIFGGVPGRPTVTLYNHLDVQPASRETEPWKTDPFRLLIRGDRYFGRGTTDDKGPALAALFGARAAQKFDVPVNVHLLWEFEEEIGSPSLEGIVAREARRLRTDSIVVSDTGWLSRSIPSAPSGLRGLQGLSFVLETGRADRHSGDVGGAARNPIAELLELMHRIHDPRTGRVKVPGFYRHVIPPSRRELEDFKNSGFTVKGFKRDNLLTSLRTEDPLAVMKRIWAEPTFEIHGVDGGYAGPGLKAIVPHRAEVKASCRLVPDQKPEEIARLIAAFARGVNPDVTVRSMGASPPYRGFTSGPEAEAVKRALEFAFGKKPVFIRDGGSIGAVVTLKKVLRCPVMFLGLSLPEHGYHAPNENFDWRQAGGGIVAFAKYLDEVSRISYRGST
jgi:acetylornithine deacetylase/succinyl-diaminopimelate desuccinylase-like protein